MKNLPIRAVPVPLDAATMSTPDAPAPAPAPAPARWRIAWLFAAPHRLAFAAAALMLGASALWWALAMAARALGLPLVWGLPATLAHGLLMGLGFMPMFFAGFLFTAGPKWLGQPAVAARALVGPLSAQLCGWGVFMLGTHAGSPALAATLGAAGLAAVAIGWSGVWLRFAALWRTSRAGDRVHAGVVVAGGAIGMLALWGATAGIALGAHESVRAATLAALWGFVGLVFAAVSHRMIPFFTASALPMLDAWRPLWLLGFFVAALLAQAVFALAEVLWWPLPAVLRVAQAAVELPAAALLLALALRWGLVQSLRVRLLAMLHLGFVWLGLALLLSGVSHVLMAAGGDARSLGLAPLHAYTMGFLGSTLMAMATRVSAGHGGRPLAADDFVWRLFGLLQVAVLLRVGVAAATALGHPPAPAWLAAAALAWAAAMGAWALRYGRWYGRPRADGRPG